MKKIDRIIKEEIENTLTKQEIFNQYVQYCNDIFNGRIHPTHSEMCRQLNAFRQMCYELPSHDCHMSIDYEDDGDIIRVHHSINGYDHFFSFDKDGKLRKMNGKPIQDNRPIMY